LLRKYPIRLLQRYIAGKLFETLSISFEVRFVYCITLKLEDLNLGLTDRCRYPPEKLDTRDVTSLDKAISRNPCKIALGGMDGYPEVD
jgi:hypothetical protein